GGEGEVRRSKRAGELEGIVSAAGGGSNGVASAADDVGVGAVATGDGVVGAIEQHGHFAPAGDGDAGVAGPRVDGAHRRSAAAAELNGVASAGAAADEIDG